MIGQIGTDGATGYVIEYAGDVIRGLSMEGRMTLCNMSIEAGARAAMGGARRNDVSRTSKGRRFAPQGEAWEKAVAFTGGRWRTDSGAQFR